MTRVNFQGERIALKHTIPYVKYMTSVSLMHEAPKIGAWDNLEEKGRERGGKEVQDCRDTCIPIANSC